MQQLVALYFSLEDGKLERVGREEERICESC
jgi:hypothetical protein